MTRIATTRRAPIDAASLRFLLLFVGGWLVIRAMANWTPAIPMPPPGAPPVPWRAEPAQPRWLGAAVPEVTRTRAQLAPIRRTYSSAAPSASVAPPPVADVAMPAAARPDVRLSLMARLLPPLPGGGAQAVFAAPKPWVATPPARTTPPAAGKPFWMQRQLAGWSLGTWAYLRQGTRTDDRNIAAAGQLGGSQAGARLSYGFGETGRLRGYARATIALAAPRQRELALGFTFAPLRRLPVDIAIEQRIAVGREGRTALAAMVVAGVGDVPLPHRFRLEAYGQAGVVGAQRRDLFAEGAVTVDREIARTRDASLHVGALAAGSVQPGAARVDIGPRLTLRLPEVGEGSRVALDWRQRVAGRARPDSGLALTLASDF